MPARISPALRARLNRVQLFLCDVDGVLTDASVFVGQETEVKRFHIQDGLGLLLLKREGIRVGWISARKSSATTLRATELEIDFLHQEKGSKRAAVEQILSKTGLKWENVCYVGDDIVDLSALKHAGVAVAVANGIAEVKDIAHYVTRSHGGHGAVREVVELILKAQNRWQRLVEQHLAL